MKADYIQEPFLLFGEGKSICRERELLNLMCMTQLLKRGKINYFLV